MPVTYERCPNEVTSIMKEVMAEYHPDLKNAGLKVACIFAECPKDQAGEPLRPAVMVHGFPAAAKAKIIGLKERSDGRSDAEIVIDRDEWEGAPEPRQRALLDHELNHFELKLDPDTGAVLTDDLSRPKLRLRKHDHQFGWFNIIAQRHGEQSYECRQARAFADKHGQLYFGFSGENGGGPSPVVPDADVMKSLSKRKSAVGVA